MSTFSASKRFSTAASTNLAESGNRELLISQLRAEILEVKQNEREYFDLSAQLKKLESRYAVLQEDKARGEADFKTRNTINFDTIANLRTDVDTLKATINDTKIEIQELRVENQSAKEAADQKTHEAQHYKAEVAQASDYNTNLSETKRRQEAELEIARDEKRKILGQLKEARATHDDLTYKNNELEKIMKEIEFKNSRIERNNDQTQQAIDNLTGELRTRGDNLDVIEQQVVDSQKAILSLERDIQDAERENERTKVEASRSNKIYQQEVTKNLDLTAKVAVLENSLKAKEAELAELKRDQENLKATHTNNLDTSFQLKQELDSIKADIDALSNQNAELVEELDRVVAEDEQVRAILNRSDRVEALKFKAESHVKKSAYKSKANHFSPSPDRNPARQSLGKSPLKSSLRKSPFRY